MDSKDGGEVSNQPQEFMAVYTRLHEKAIKLEETVGQLGEATEKLREFGDDLKEYASSFVEVMDTLGEKEEKIEDQVKTLEQLKNELDDAKEKWLEEKIQELQQELQTQQQEYAEKNNEIVNLKQELQALQQMCSEKDNEIENLKQELQTQQHTCSEKDNKIEILKQKIQEEETQRQRTTTTPEIYSEESELTIPLISERPNVEVHGRDENESLMARRMYFELVILLLTVLLVIVSGCFGVLIKLHAGVRVKTGFLTGVGVGTSLYVVMLVANRIVVVKLNGPFFRFELVLECMGIVLMALVTIGTGLNSMAPDKTYIPSDVLSMLSCASSFMLAIAGAKANWPRQPHLENAHDRVL